jgi:hypothetical protein
MTTIAADVQQAVVDREAQGIGTAIEKNLGNGELILANREVERSTVCILTAD